MTLSAIARPPLEPTSEPPLIVLLHGLAADENDLIGIAGELDPRLYVVSVRAPYETGYGGYAWFGIEFYADGSRSMDEAQAVSSRDLLISELEGLPATLGFMPSKTILAGFSQGAMMTAGVLFARPDLVDAAWLMSGRYLPVLDSKADGEGKPVLGQHGVYDDVLRVEEGRDLARAVREHNFDLRFEEYAMGHQISNESLRDAAEWMRLLG